MITNVTQITGSPFTAIVTDDGTYAVRVDSQLERELLDRIAQRPELTYHPNSFITDTKTCISASSGDDDFYILFTHEKPVPVNTDGEMLALLLPDAG